mmetsp:Transcript_9802/g.18436  ORF Transcript_9802/g.18436 Transcript_9802/m.18436 type:complete len:216 (+) Transcript_9802:3400-4047(+)
MFSLFILFLFLTLFTALGRLGLFVSGAFSPQRFSDLLHNIQILSWCSSSFIKLEPLLYLFPQFFSIDLCRFIAKGINPCCNRAFVCQISTNASFVLCSCTAYEGRMVDETILWCIALGLQCTEKSLFGTKNLHRRCRGFCQICKRSCLANQPSSNGVTNECTQVGCNDGHLVGQIKGKLLTEFSQFDHSLSEVDNIHHIYGRTFHSHGCFCSGNY